MRINTKLTGEPLACDIESAVSDFLDYANSKNLSPMTIKYYQQQLATFQRFLKANYPNLGLGEVSKDIIRHLVTVEKDRTSASTANHCLAVIYRFFRYLREERQVRGRNPAKGVEKLKTPKIVIQTFSMEQIAAILEQCGWDFYGHRDWAVIALLLDTGMRASELCNIKLDDINWDDRLIRVVGKGNKERMVPFCTKMKTGLKRYLKVRQSPDTDMFFVNHFGQPLNRYRLAELIRRRCKQAGVKGVRPSPHTMRHTFAVYWLRNGGDTFSLQRILGHVSLEMTERYCQTLSCEDAARKHEDFSPADKVVKDIKKGRKRLM